MRYLSDPVLYRWLRLRSSDIINVQHPGLRLKQYEEILYKRFQKAPENP